MPLHVVVLSWLLALAPATPWSDEYPRLAHAIAEASSSLQEAAEVTAIAFRESTLNPRAIGDHGRSLGVGQVSRHWVPRGVNQDAFLDDVELQVATVVRLVRESHAMCRAKDKALALSWYAAGGGGCEQRHRTSRDRMRIARGLLEGAAVP